MTRQDFLKNLQLSPYADLQHKWQRFIKRTPAISTDKPETIGHIMTRKVNVIAASASFSEAQRRPPPRSSGRQEQRFIGLVSQADLIGELFNQQISPMYCYLREGDNEFIGD